MTDNDPVNRQDPFNLDDLNKRRQRIEGLEWAFGEFFLTPGPEWWVAIGRGIAGVGVVVSFLCLLIRMPQLVATMAGNTASRWDPPAVFDIGLIIGATLAGLGLLIGLAPSYLDEVSISPRRPTPKGVGRAALTQLGSAYAAFQREINKNKSDHQREVVRQALGGELGDPLVRQRPGRDALEIVASRAWNDPWLADHRLDIDPITEATEIYTYLGQVAEKVNDLLSKAARHEGTPTEQTYRRYADDLTADLSAVRGRIEALHDYQRQIGRRSTLLDAEDQLPDLEQDAEEVRALMAESRRHEMAAEHLNRQRRELEAIESGLRDIATSLAEDTTIQLPSAKQS